MPRQNWEEWWYPAIPGVESGDDEKILIELRENVDNFNFYFSKIIHNSNLIEKLIWNSLKFSNNVFSEKSVDCYYASLIIGASRTWGPIGNDTGKPLNEILATDPWTPFRHA